MMHHLRQAASFAQCRVETSNVDSIVWNYTKLSTTTKGNQKVNDSRTSPLRKHSFHNNISSSRVWALCSTNHTNNMQNHGFLTLHHCIILQHYYEDAPSEASRIIRPMPSWDQQCRLNSLKLHKALHDGKRKSKSQRFTQFSSSETFFSQQHRQQRLCSTNHNNNSKSWLDTTSNRARQSTKIWFCYTPWVLSSNIKWLTQFT